MKLLRLSLTALVYFSMASVIAEAALLGVLWMKGSLKRETFIQLLAISQDVDLQTMWRKLEARAQPFEVEQVSFDEVLAARKEVSLDLDLKEVAADKGLIDVRQLDFLLDQERKQYDSLKGNFDQDFETVQQGAVNESTKEVQRQLESIDAKLAKDQLLRILDDPAFDSTTSMHFVVTMFKAMPLEKRKKILTEFKSEADVGRLNEILRQIRLGVPDIDVIRQTQEQLETFNSRF
jgi:hypothetical protein